MEPGARIRLARPTPSTQLWRGTVIAVNPDSPFSIQIQWDHTLTRSSYRRTELKEVT